MRCWIKVYRTILTGITVWWCLLFYEVKTAMSELTPKELYIRQISIPGDIPADNYVAQIPIVQHLMRHSLELHKPVTIFVGENGIGKSTLIEAIAVAMRFNAEGGTKNFNFAGEQKIGKS